MTFTLKLTVALDPAVVRLLDRLLDQRGGLTKQEAAELTDQLAELDRRLSAVAKEPPGSV